MGELTTSNLTPICLAWSEIFWALTDASCENPRIHFSWQSQPEVSHMIAFQAQASLHEMGGNLTTSGTTRRALFKVSRAPGRGGMLWALG
jgi:hypothetical protein